MASAQPSSKSNMSTYTDDGFDTNIATKLRRLKIEESVISKSICSKITEDFQEENGDGFQYSAYKLLLHKLKTSFIDIRDLFEEIKDNTSTCDNLQCLDIDDMKKDMMNMETKIQNIKTYLQTQIKALQENEQELIKGISEQPDELDRIRRQPKVKKIPYNEIVPSPVKVLINSPFKCVEVQQFQEFLMTNKNRYGGWILYNHNIFEKSWRKYFSAQNNIDDFEYREEYLENSELFQIFVKEMCEKIPGITFVEIMAHSKWYSKYLYLKRRQQRALEKWRTNRQIIKRSRQSARILSGQKKSENPDRNEIKVDDDGAINTLVSDEFKKMTNIYHKETNSYSSEQNESLFQDSKDSSDKVTMKHRKSFQRNITKAISNRPTLAYRNSTEQWNNRCNGMDGYPDNYLNIENLTIMKRRIPDWRLVLQNQ
ncbi:coiled-coil domain-containing protein 112-like [Pectinophora gossypiella]|nr:coiled-coil domain-containing protein 112-like [Pectinophora gossypiella]